jgi:hypothetical protein
MNFKHRRLCPLRCQTQEELQLARHVSMKQHLRLLCMQKAPLSQLHLQEMANGMCTGPTSDPFNRMSNDNVTVNLGQTFDVCMTVQRLKRDPVPR